MQFSFGSFYNFFTIYATDNGISMDMTIYLWSFGVLVEVLMFFTQAKLLQKSLLFIIEISVFATAFRWFLVYLFADNIMVLFFSQAIHALSFALFHSASISYLFMHYKNRSLAQQLFSGLSYGLGGLMGAFIAGLIYEYYPSYLFLSSSSFALLALGFFLLWNRRCDNRKKSDYFSSPL
jgi:PPP family 3-phenylpropionic acid transporter